MLYGQMGAFAIAGGDLYDRSIGRVGRGAMKVGTPTWNAIGSFKEGKAFQRGVGEGLGFMSIEVGGKNISGGWLGRDMFAATAYQNKFNSVFKDMTSKRINSTSATAFSHSEALKASKDMGGSWSYTAGRVSSEAQLATKSFRNASRFAKGAAPVAMRLLGPVFTAMAVYEGYREGGVIGAAVSGGKEIAIWGAMEFGLSMLGGMTMGLAAFTGGGALLGVGGYAFGKMSASYGKGLKSIEMGSPIIDEFGTLATTRQRSLAALNLSHVNGRQALGNEASLMHLSVAR